MLQKIQAGAFYFNAKDESRNDDVFPILNYYSIGGAAQNGIVMFFQIQSVNYIKYFMLLASKIAPILDREVGEQNLVFLSEYCSRDSGNAFISAKDG
jgi:hypothetical protein